MGCYTEMTLGWNHHQLYPRQVDTTKEYWLGLSNRHFDHVVSTIIALCKEMKCVVCGDKESPIFKSFAGLAIHLRYHRPKTIEWWFNNIIPKSPKELQELVC